MPVPCRITSPVEAKNDHRCIEPSSPAKGSSSRILEKTSVTATSLQDRSAERATSPPPPSSRTAQRMRQSRKTRPARHLHTTNERSETRCRVPTRGTRQPDLRDQNASNPSPSPRTTTDGQRRSEGHFIPTAAALSAMTPASRTPNLDQN